MKNLLLILTMILGLTAPLSALDLLWPEASRILVPPAKYDPSIEGKEYRGKLVIKMVDRAKVYTTCTGGNPNSNVGPRVLACAKPNKPRKGFCTIILPIGMPDDLARAVRRHEEAHCKGWKHAKRTGTQATMIIVDDHDHEADEEVGG